MAHTVRIIRQYVSASTRELVDGLDEAAWAALLAAVAERAPGAPVGAFTNAQGSGVDVTVATQRGPGGTFALHGLACDYGALAVVL